MVIEGPEIVNDPDEKEPSGQQVENAGQPFPHIHPVDAEQAEEGQQQPGDIVVDVAFDEANIRLAVHLGNQEQIDDPADKQQAEGEEIDGSGDWPAVVKAVHAEKAEYPEEVAKKGGVGLLLAHVVSCMKLIT